MTTKLLLCTQCEVNPTAAAVCDQPSNAQGGREERRKGSIHRSGDLPLRGARGRIIGSGNSSKNAVYAAVPSVQTQSGLSAPHSPRVLRINLVKCHS